MPIPIAVSGYIGTRSGSKPKVTARRPPRRSSKGRLPVGGRVKVDCPSAEGTRPTALAAGNRPALLSINHLKRIAMKSKKAKKAEKVIRSKKYSCFTDLMVVRKGVLTHTVGQTSCACDEHNPPFQNVPGISDLFHSKIAVHLYH